MSKGVNPFVKARKQQSKLRFLLSGPSGSGKTWMALDIGTRLAELEGGRVALLDTEGGSSALYADAFDFDVMTLVDNYDPDEYVAAMHAAVEHGYAVLIVDSWSHAWNGAGGVLEIVDEAGQKMGGNDWAGWSKGRPKQNNLVSNILSIPIHLIGTARAKTIWAQTPNPRNGKLTPVKVGEGAVQSSEFEYEFTFSGMLDMDHQIHMTKVRGQVLEVGQIIDDTDYMVRSIHSWLTDGDPPAPKAAGDTWLRSQRAKDELREALAKFGYKEADKDFWLSHIEPGKMLQRFGDTMLNKQQFMSRLAEIAAMRPSAPAPAPTQQQPASGPKTAGETWLRTNAEQQALAKHLADAGYTDKNKNRWLELIEPGRTLTRFGESTLTKEQFYKRVGEIALELNPRPQPSATPEKQQEPQAAENGLPNPVLADAVYYMDGGTNTTKYLAFVTDAGTIRAYGRTTTFRKAVGDDYYRANGFDDMEANTDEPYEIDTLEITWERKSPKNGNPYLTATTFRVVSPDEDEPSGDPLDEFFNNDDFMFHKQAEAAR